MDSHKKLGQLKLDFKHEMKYPFKTYYITEYEHGTCFIYAAFKENPDQIAGNGLTFAISHDLNPNQNFEAIKKQKGAI